MAGHQQADQPPDNFAHALCMQNAPADTGAPAVCTANDMQDVCGVEMGRHPLHARRDTRCQAKVVHDCRGADVRCNMHRLLTMQAYHEEETGHPARQ